MAFSPPHNGTTTTTDHCTTISPPNKSDKHIDPTLTIYPMGVTY